MTIVIFVLNGCASPQINEYSNNIDEYSRIMSSRDRMGDIFYGSPVNARENSSSQMDMCFGNKAGQTVNYPSVNDMHNIDLDEINTVEEFCQTYREATPLAAHCYANCERRFANDFDRIKLEKQIKKDEEIARQRENEEIAKAEEKKQAAIHYDIRSGKIKPEDMKQAKIAYDAGDGFAVAKAPKLRPDGQLYALSGLISAAEDRTAVFFGEVATWSNSLIPIKEFNYVGVRIPKELQDHYFDNARINGWFGIVGRYVDNSSYKNILGSGQTIPVFDAVYLELER
jgi:hypothetical protein